MLYGAGHAGGDVEARRHHGASLAHLAVGRRQAGVDGCARGAERRAARQRGGQGAQQREAGGVARAAAAGDDCSGGGEVRRRWC
jgi:hypothetical protein